MTITLNPSLSTRIKTLIVNGLCITQGRFQRPVFDPFFALFSGSPGATYASYRTLPFGELVA
ncbi:MAG: hypothetical protein J0M24_24305 [Verrucomicrobia bacterium]|nr:hypothetical protein [Verrucomicrobiota bacterium]